MTQQPSIAAPTTKVLAIGLVTPQGTPDAVRSVIDREVRDTVRLYLAGKIDQWFAQTERNGVAFLMNAASCAEARQMLQDLPLAKAGLMEFELIALGPLEPLRTLLGAS